MTQTKTDMAEKDSGCWVIYGHKRNGPQDVIYEEPGKTDPLVYRSLVSHCTQLDTFSRRGWALSLVNMSHSNSKHVQGETREVIGLVITFATKAKDFSGREGTVLCVGCEVTPALLKNGHVSDYIVQIIRYLNRSVAEITYATKWQRDMQQSESEDQAERLAIGLVETLERLLRSHEIEQNKGSDIDVEVDCRDSIYRYSHDDTTRVIRVMCGILKSVYLSKKEWSVITNGRLREKESGATAFFEEGLSEEEEYSNLPRYEKIITRNREGPIPDEISEKETRNSGDQQNKGVLNHTDDLKKETQNGALQKLSKSTSELIGEGTNQGNGDSSETINKLNSDTMRANDNVADKSTGDSARKDDTSKAGITKVNADEVIISTNSTQFDVNQKIYRILAVIVALEAIQCILQLFYLLGIGR